MPQTLLQPKSTAPPSRRPGGDAYRALAVCAGLIVAVAVVFGQTLRFEFLHYDDNYYVFNEPHVSHGFTLQGIAWAFTNGPLGEFYPLSMLSHMLDCQLFGLNPLGHHLTGVILHAATSCGLFLVLWRMTGGLWPSALVAAIFAVHPQHVESVAWIAERRDMLSGLFFVLTLAAYDQYARHPQSWLRYGLVAGFLTLGLLAKGVLVTVPPLLLLLDYWPLGRFGQSGSADIGSGKARAWRLVLEKLPLLAIALAGAAMTLFTHSTRPDPLTIGERLANAAVSYVAYLEQFFVPLGLIDLLCPSRRRVAGLAGCHRGAALAGDHIRRPRLPSSPPFFFVGWFWYLGMLVPVLGLVYVADHARADRYMYLPQIGLSIAVVWGAMWLGAGWSARRWVFGIGSAAILLALTAYAWRQTTFWQNDQTLWGRAVACNPRHPVAFLMLGDALDGRDDDAAIDQYGRAVKIGPADWKLYRSARAKAYNALGAIALRQRRLDEAVADFKRAIEIDPSLAHAHMNLGIQLSEQGRLDEAAVEFAAQPGAVPLAGGDQLCQPGPSPA